MISWKAFGDFVLFIVAILSFLFAFLYTFTAPWYRSPIGRSMFAVLLSLASGIAYFSWAVHHTPLPIGFYPIRALLFSVLAVSIGTSAMLLARAQWSGHPKRRKSADELENARQVDHDGPRRSGNGGDHRVPRRRG